MFENTQVYAIVRLSTDSSNPAEAGGPGITGEWLDGVSVKDVSVTAVLPTEQEAVLEVARLNAIAKKGDRYFWMASRFYPTGRSRK